jgi:2-polyprenyl-6-methoxyphenol hydroxylase-like FAD-dependent oxidoreductase
LDAPDVAIVGAGAAGLATAIFLRRFNPARSVVLLDSARKPGAIRVAFRVLFISDCRLTRRESAGQETRSPEIRV